MCSDWHVNYYILSLTQINLFCWARTWFADFTDIWSLIKLLLSDNWNDNVITVIHTTPIVSFTLSRCLPRQFVAGGPGRTGTNREGTRVCLYIPGSATDQTRLFGKKWSRSVMGMLQFATVHSRCSPGGATMCPATSRYATALPRASATEPRCHYGESRE